jgi:hypothetical protein
MKSVKPFLFGIQIPQSVLEAFTVLKCVELDTYVQNVVEMYYSYLIRLL